MKYRKDFVTNSSSSSFICDVCGEKACGFNMCLSDAGMYRCENGHIFCKDHMFELTREEKESYLISLYDGDFRHEELKPENVKNLSDNELDDTVDYWTEDGYVPEKMCPICAFKYAKDEDIAEYLMKKDSVNRLDILTIWASQFGNYKDLKDFLED